MALEEAGEPKLPPEAQQQEESAEKATGGNDKNNEIVERFVTNAMMIASGDNYDKMLAMAKSAKGDSAQGVGRAIFFVMDAVRKGLTKKGVEIPSELWLAKNGLLDQTSKIVSILLDSAGVKMDAESVQQGMSLAAETMASNFDIENGKEPMKPEGQGEPTDEEVMQLMQQMQGQGGGQPPQGGMPPQGMPPQGGQPPQQAPQQPPQGGLLEQGRTR